MQKPFAIKTNFPVRGRKLHGFIGDIDAITGLIKTNFPVRGRKHEAFFDDMFVSPHEIKTNFPVRGRKLISLTPLLQPPSQDQNQLPRKGTETLFG